jgi:hypothetical protein
MRRARCSSGDPSPHWATRIPEHIGDPTTAPVLSPARAPPTRKETFDHTPVFDPTAAAPRPAFAFDQRVTR